MKSSKKLLSLIIVLALLMSTAVLGTNAMIAPLSKGEVDNINSITIKDATLVQKYIADLETFSKQQLFCADTDFDGIITIKDATMIQKYVADIIKRFPYPDDYRDTFDYIRSQYFYADYNSGTAMTGTPVTFTAHADGALTYEYKINGQVVRERNDQNSFTTTFDEAGIYSVEVVMYNWCDTTTKEVMEYEVVPPYTFDTLQLRALYYDHNTDWQYTHSFTATAMAFMGSGDYEYEFSFDDIVVQGFSSNNQYTRQCNPYEEYGYHNLTVRIRDNANPQEVIEATLEVIISNAIG